MTLAALIDAGVDVEAIRQGLYSLGLPIRLEVEKVRKGGFAATFVHVEAPSEDEHRFLPEVEEILQRGQLTPRQRDLALRIFRRLAEAESAAHGMPLDKVHFHEVGALDSIADIAGAAIALDLLGADASPVARCRPATAWSSVLTVSCRSPPRAPPLCSRACRSQRPLSRPS